MLEREFLNPLSVYLCSIDGVVGDIICWVGKAGNIEFGSMNSQ